MAQHRPPPCYQEYAASILANNDFRMMSLSSRGLFYTLRLEYWVANPLPADPIKLGKILGFETLAIQTALIELGGLISVEEGHIKMADLDDYRAHLAERKQLQSEGGKKGAARSKQNAQQQKNEEIEPVTQQGNPQVAHRVTQGYLVQSKTVEPSSTQYSSVINKEISEWVKDYEREE